MTVPATRVSGTADKAIPETLRGRLEKAVSALLTVVVVVAGLLALIVVVVPRMIGGGTFTVVSGSMQPTLRPGDVVLVRPVDPRDVRVGDVVTFHPLSDDPTLVTHRVVSRSVAASGPVFVTRGDSNSADDNPISGQQIVGEVWLTVPLVGYASIWLGNNLQLVTSVAGLVLLAYAVMLAVCWVRKRFHQKGSAA